jgi:hypothetical protein
MVRASYHYRKSGKVVSKHRSALLGRAATKREVKIAASPASMAGPLLLRSLQNLVRREADKKGHKTTAKKLGRSFVCHHLRRIATSGNGFALRPFT